MIRNSSSITLGTAAAMLLALSPARAGEFEPPDTGFKSRGPAVIGMAIITDNRTEPPTANIDFVGRCKGQDIDQNLPSISLGTAVPDLTKESLTGSYLMGAGDLVAAATGGACAEGPDLVVQAVHAFENMGETVVADVVMLFAIPQ